MQQLFALPPNTPVHVQALTAEAEALLNGLGFHVTHLPNGQIVVDANTGPALNAAYNAVATINGMRAIFSVDGSVHFPGGLRASAEGNILAAAYATGTAIGRRSRL